VGIGKKRAPEIGFYSTINSGLTTNYRVFKKFDLYFYTIPNNISNNQPIERTNTTNTTNEPNNEPNNERTQQRKQQKTKKTKKMPFFEANKTNANKIIEAMTKGFHYILLVLQMQGGKTNSYLYSALRLLDLKTIKRVIIITGSSDLDLYEQLNDSIKTAVHSYVFDYHNDSNSKAIIYEKQIKIYKPSELKKIKDLLDDTLIIHDETHYAQSKDNIPYKDFYKKFNIEQSLHNDFTEIKKRNLFILGISATPFSEIIANKTVELNLLDDITPVNDCNRDQKSIIYGDVGDTYVGIREYYQSNRIKFYDFSKKHIYDNVYNILKNISNKKYFIVRSKSPDIQFQCLADRCGYDYKELNSKTEASKKNDIGHEPFGFLETEPERPTIIHIKAFARMGKVLNKMYISGVLETSIKPKTDTLLQALPGRMCGYDTHSDITIHVSIEAKTELDSYTSNKYDEICKAMNIIGKSKSKQNQHTMENYTKDTNETWWNPIVPFKIEKTKMKKTEFEKLQGGNPHIIANYIEDNYPRDPRNKCVLDFLKKDVKLAKRDASSDASSYTGFMEKFEDACKANVPERCNFTNMVWEHPTNKVIEYGLFKGDTVAYLYGYTKVIDEQTINSINHKFNNKLPKVKPKANYIKCGDEDDQFQKKHQNNSPLISQPLKVSVNDIYNNHETLEHMLDVAIHNSLDPTNLLSRCLMFNNGQCFKKKSLVSFIQLSRDEYTAEIIKQIKRTLKAHHNVDVKFEEISSKKNPQDVRYRKISW